MPDDLAKLRADLATALGLRPDTRTVRIADVELEIQTEARALAVRLGKQRAVISLADGWVHETTEFIANARRAMIAKSRKFQS
jgi:hypothetical protein